MTKTERSISAQLRRTIQESEATLYRIAKDSGVDWGTLQRFVEETRPNIRIETVDKLCAYFGLTLQAAETKKPAKRKG